VPRVYTSAGKHLNFLNASLTLIIPPGLSPHFHWAIVSINGSATCNKIVKSPHSWIGRSNRPHDRIRRYSSKFCCHVRRLSISHPLKARFALCATEQWSRFDSHFDNEAFFNNIVDLFETDPSDPWVTDTLAWWRK
jgi:hypothetical protein